MGLIELGALPLIEAYDGRTGLVAAVVMQRHETVRLLMQLGCDINLEASNGYTPLVAAAVRGEPSMIHTLVEQKAEVDRETSQGYTALLAAVINNQVEVMDALVEHSVDVNLETAGGARVRAWAAAPRAHARRAAQRARLVARAHGQGGDAGPRRAVVHRGLRAAHARARRRALPAR